MCIKMLFHLYVTLGKFSSRRHIAQKTSWALDTAGRRKHIRAKYNWVLGVSNNDVGAGKHGRVLAHSGNKLEIDYLKIGKVMHDMLDGNYVSHIIGLASAGGELKLLFMAHNGGQVTILCTRSYVIPSYYLKTSFKPLERILMEILRLSMTIYCFIACHSQLRQMLYRLSWPEVSRIIPCTLWLELCCRCVACHQRWKRTGKMSRVSSNRKA